MITRRREAGQWLVLMAIAVLVLGAAYLIVVELAVGAAGCACTEAPLPSVVSTSG